MQLPQGSRKGTIPDHVPVQKYRGKKLTKKLQKYILKVFTCTCAHTQKSLTAPNIENKLNEQTNNDDNNHQMNNTIPLR